VTERDQWDDMLDRHRVPGPSTRWSPDQVARDAAYRDMQSLVAYIRRTEAAIAHYVGRMGEALDTWGQEMRAAREPAEGGER